VQVKPRTVHRATAAKGAHGMKRTFTGSITQEGDWYVAQRLEVGVASQGDTEEEALVNLGEALTLHLTPPFATARPDLRPVEVEIGAA
jgi:predicted RNase H-like HicB family nuclease